MIYEFPKSESGFARTETLTLEAGRVKIVENYGRTFVCLLAGAAFKVSFNGGEYFDMLQGARFTLQPNERFTLIKLLSDVAQEVTILTGNIDYDPPRTITVAPTRAIPNASTIAAGASIDLTTAPSGTSYRKAVIISNNDPGSDLDIYTQDASGAWQLAEIVLHTESKYLETSDAIRIKNNTAGTINLRVVEFFYLSQ